MIRTCDTRIRNPVLYPLSYEGTVAEIVEISYFFVFAPIPFCPHPVLTS
jgi:hypothetical protein